MKKKVIDAQHYLTLDPNVPTCVTHDYYDYSTTPECPWCRIEDLEKEVARLKKQIGD